MITIEKLPKKTTERVNKAALLAECCEGKFTSSIRQLKNGTFEFRFPQMPNMIYKYRAPTKEIRYLNESTGYGSMLRTTKGCDKSKGEFKRKNFTFDQAMKYFYDRFSPTADQAKNIASLKKGLTMRASNPYLPNIGKDEIKMLKNKIKELGGCYN